MKELQKNCSLQNKINWFAFIFKRSFMALILSTPAISPSQIANYVSNGSFEENYKCPGISSELKIVRNWASIDSTNFAAVYHGICNGSVPRSGDQYQYPR